MNKILLKEFTEPTDIFILGDSNPKATPTFCLRDDECTIDIRRGNNIVTLNTFGFGYIHTLEELINTVDLIEYETIADAIFLEEFEGSIYAILESESGEVKFSEDVDLKDYLYYQHTETDEDIEITLLIEDTRGWGAFFQYGTFQVAMLRKIVEATKKLNEGS